MLRTRRKVKCFQRWKIWRNTASSEKFSAVKTSILTRLKYTAFPHWILMFRGFSTVGEKKTRYHFWRFMAETTISAWFYWKIQNMGLGQMSYHIHWLNKEMQFLKLQNVQRESISYFHDFFNVLIVLGISFSFCLTISQETCLLSFITLYFMKYFSIDRCHDRQYFMQLGTKEEMLNSQITWIIKFLQDPSSPPEVIRSCKFKW